MYFFTHSLTYSPVQEVDVIPVLWEGKERARRFQGVASAHSEPVAEVGLESKSCDAKCMAVVSLPGRQELIFRLLTFSI